MAQCYYEEDQYFIMAVIMVVEPSVHLIFKVNFHEHISKYNSPEQTCCKIECKTFSYHTCIYVIKNVVIYVYAERVKNNQNQ